MSETLGDRIKQRRTELGWNGAELARQASLNRATCWRFEEGKSLPNAADLVALATVLQVTADWLLGLPERSAEVEVRALKEEVWALRLGIRALMHHGPKAIGIGECVIAEGRWSIIIAGEPEMVENQMRVSILDMVENRKVIEKPQ